MAEAPPNGNGLQLKTAFGEVAARGSQVVSAVLLAVLTGVALYEHRLRSDEHLRIIDEVIRNREIIAVALDQSGCLNKLAMFQAMSPTRGQMDWANLPTELYSCMPKFLMEPRK